MSEKWIHETLLAEFERRGPWVTGFERDGKVYGMPAFTPAGIMERHAFACFPQARSVMELGCLEAGRTRYLAAWARHVLGVDGRRDNLERARWIAELYGLDNVELLPPWNLEDGLPEAPACDLIYCVGVLYHMPRPWELIAAMAARCPNLFLWTHIAADEEATETIHGRRYKRYREFGLGDPLSGMSAESLWPTRAALLDLLASVGYTIGHIEDDAHKHGSAVTIACWRS